MQDSTKENKYESNSKEKAVFTFEDDENQNVKLNDDGFVFKKDYDNVSTQSEQAEDYVDADEFMNKLNQKAENLSENNQAIDLNAHFEAQSAMLQESLSKNERSFKNNDNWDALDTPYYGEDEEVSEDEVITESINNIPEQDEIEKIEEKPVRQESKIKETKNSNSILEDEEQESNIFENGTGTKNEKLKKLQASAVNEDSLWNRSKEAFDKVFENDSIDKKRSILGLDFKFWKIFLLLFYAVDVVFYNFAVYKVAYPLIENIAKSLGIEALQQSSYEKYYVLFSYIVAFFVGGALLMIIMKLVRKLMDGVGIHESVLIIRSVTIIVLVVFLVGSIIMGISKGFLVSETYRWAAPCIAYIAGILGDFWF